MPKSSVTFTYRGLIVPVFTPFNNDSAKTLNLNAIPRYAEFLHRKNVPGILVNGTVGEGMAMSVAERQLVANAWASAIKNRSMHLMVQVGGAPLPDVLELASHAEKLKADSLLCLPSVYYRPRTTQELVDYLKTVQSAAPSTPLLYYHIPSFTNVDIHMGEFMEAARAQIPTFAGIKFTSTNLEEAAQAISVDSSLAVFLGNDELVAAGCALGMDSVIAASGNFLPTLVLEVLEAGRAGKGLLASEKQKSLSKVVRAMMKHGNWFTTMKPTTLQITGIDLGPPRAYRALQPDRLAMLKADVAKYAAECCETQK